MLLLWAFWDELGGHVRMCLPGAPGVGSPGLLLEVRCLQHGTGKVGALGEPRRTDPDSLHIPVLTDSQFLSRPWIKLICLERCKAGTWKNPKFIL